MDYRIIYVGTQAIFGVLFLTLLILRHTNERGQRLNKLDALYALFILTAVLDGTWMLIDGVPNMRSAHVALQVVYLSTMALTGYTWFLYTLDSFPAQSMKLRRYRFVLGIPVLITIVLIVCSIRTSWMFIVDENGTYTRGPLHIYSIIANYAYMLLASYVALRCRKDALLTMDKRRYGAIALFPVPVLVLSGIQLLLPPGLPAMQGGVFISLLLLFGTSQNVLITRDYLTGLPNRSAFEQDLLEHMHRYRAADQAHLYVMEGDLNKFKHINDTYGHPTGDKALQLAAEALEEVFTPYGAAVFRTGGDEFSMIAETDEVLHVEALRAELNDRLAQASVADDIVLSMSLGIKEYDGITEFRELIKGVDESLYAAKNALRSQ